MNLPHNEQKHNNNQLSLQHIGNLAYRKSKTATNYDSVNSLTTYNNHYTLLYPDLVQELFDFALHNSNSTTNNSPFLRSVGVNNTKYSSLDSLLSPRDILFFLQIVSLYQLELSKGNTSITYPSLKLAKLLGVDASCDTTHLTANTHNSVNSLTDANMRATILKMTAKLESLGLLKVFRSKRSNGMDKANTLIPVLPDRLHAKLQGLPANLKVCDSSKSDHESNLEHILSTKLFVPIELEFMKSLFRNNLPSKYKLFFLNCIMSAYRNFRHNFCSSDMLSFSATSRELMKKNDISRSTLDRIFRYVKQQGDSFFLKVEHKYTKSDDIDSNRYDKSIFVISINPLVFPIASTNIDKLKRLHEEELESGDMNDENCRNGRMSHDEFQDTNSPIFPDTYKGFKTAWSKKQPSIIIKTALNNKDIIIKNKDIDYIDANCENSSISCSSSTLTSEQHYKEEFLEDKQSLSSSEFYNNSSFFNDSFADFTDSQQQNSEVLRFKQPCSNKNPEVDTRVIKDISEYKELRHFYPISSEDSKKLNFCAGREFDTNFTNQLLLKLYIKYPEKKFKNKFTFSDYMVKALKKEKHQGPRVNNPSFRFSCNIDEQEKRVLECEQYLIKVESSSDTCKISRVRKKIAGRFSSEISHSILTTAQFIESSSRELLTILLPENLALSKRQREILMGEVCSVYGNNKCYLDSIKTGYKISATVVAKETVDREEAQSASTSELSYSKPRSTPLSALPEDSVWRQVRESLVLQYGNDIDKAWFSKAVASECQETSLLLLTMPTRFMSDWLKNRYGYAISSISGHFGFRYIEYNY